MRIIAIILLFGQHLIGFSQGKEFFPITVDPSFQDTLTFNKYWDYQAKLYKTGSGIYDVTTDSLARPEDTVHLFHTAGIFLDDHPEIHYAYANRFRDSLFLKFGQLDQFDLYLLNFRLTITGGQYRIDSIKMPLRFRYRDTFQILSQKLILEHLPLASDSSIYGYLEMTMQRKIRISENDIRVHQYFSKGYFKTPIAEPGSAVNKGLGASLSLPKEKSIGAGLDP
jgi:hypothetical protein